MNMKVKGALLVATALMWAGPAVSQDEEADTGWGGKGEFGFVKTSGNSDNETLNFNLEFTKENELWKHRFFAAALTSSSNGVDDAERYQVEFQSNRKLSEVSYVFGVARWDSDKFGAYDPSTSIAAGYGRKLIDTERHTLIGEIGAGYRDQEDRITGESNSEAIFRLLLDDVFVITDNTQWGNRLLVESGSDNTFTQFNTGLSVAMNDAFAVKLGFEYRHNSDIPASVKDKTDTTTTVNLVYNF